MIKRIRYNLCSTTLAVGLGDDPVLDTEIEFNTPLKEGGTTGTDIPSLAQDEILVLRVGNEIMHLTDYISGEQTGTVVRGVEGSLISTHSIAADVRNVPTKVDLTPTIIDNVWFPTQDTLIGTDEFEEDVIDPAWIRVDRTGSAADLVWTQRSGVMSLYHSGNDPAQNFHGLLKPIDPSLTFPITIEACMRHAGPYAWNYLMSGIVFSDNATYGTGKTISAHGYSNSGNGSGLQVLTYGGTNWTAIPSTPGNYGQTQSPGGRYYFRLQATSVNTWNSWWSGDGVSWMSIAVNANYELSPSHFGLYHSHYGGTGQTVTTWEYFRVF